MCNKLVEEYRKRYLNPEDWILKVLTTDVIQWKRSGEGVTQEEMKKLWTRQYVKYVVELGDTEYNASVEKTDRSEINGNFEKFLVYIKYML